MRVLVVESHLGASQQLQDQLEQRGHRVLTCHADGLERRGCRAVDPEEGCPLDVEPVDVAIDVRRTYHPDPRPLERGAICAVRARVPVVVAGTSVDSPLEDWATEVVQGGVPAMIEAVEAVDGSVSPMHQKVVDDALEDILPGAGASAVVRRGEDRIEVAMTLPDDVSTAESEMVAVRVVAAVRLFDRATTTIDVSRVPSFGADVGSTAAATP